MIFNDEAYVYSTLPTNIQNSRQNYRQKNLIIVSGKKHHSTMKKSWFGVRFELNSNNMNQITWKTK